MEQRKKKIEEGKEEGRKKVQKEGRNKQKKEKGQ